MAIVVDEARPDVAAVERATELFMQPTASIVYDNAFFIKQSIVDGHVRTRRNSGGVNAPSHPPQSAYPIIDFDDFWNGVVGQEPVVDPSFNTINFTATAFAPTISSGVNITFTTIQAAFTAYAPSIGIGTEVLFDTLQMTATAFVPVVSSGEGITFATMQAAFTPYVPIIETTSDWLLNGGVWNDDGFWDDTALWQD